MTKNIKALIVPDEVVSDDLEKIIQRVGAKFQKLQDQQDKVKKVEEFNALTELLKHYETVIKLLELAEYMMRKR